MKTYSDTADDASSLKVEKVAQLRRDLAVLAAQAAALPAGSAEGVVDLEDGLRSVFSRIAMPLPLLLSGVMGRAVVQHQAVDQIGQSLDAIGDALAEGRLLGAVVREAADRGPSGMMTVLVLLLLWHLLQADAPSLEGKGWVAVITTVTRFWKEHEEGQASGKSFG